MECPFQVGDRVVCVDARATACFGSFEITELVEGKIYTVRWVGAGAGEAPGPYGMDGIGIKLTEVIRVTDHIPFAHQRFRRTKPMSFWVGEQVAKKLTEPV